MSRVEIQQRPRRRSGSAGTKRVPRREREEQILDAAARIFSERGYQDASMDEIAGSVGVTKPLVYAYFDSKEGLYQRVAARSASQLYEAVNAAVSGAPTPELALWKGIVAFFDWVEVHGGNWVVLGRENAIAAPALAGDAASARERMLELNRRLFRAVGERSGLGAQALELSEPHADAFVAASEAYARWWLAHPKEPKELPMLRLMNFVWNGLDNLQQGKLWTPPPEWWTGSSSPR